MVSVAILDKCVSALLQNQTLLTLAEATAATLPRNQPWYFIGGCVYQTVWNVLTNQPPDANIGDYDIVYFDRHSGFDEQRDYKTRIAAVAPVKIDLKNQALITADWFQRAFGIPKDTSDYLSLEDSIAKAYVSSPVIGVTWHDGQLCVLALADLDKLIKLEVFPNVKFRDERILPFYRKKCEKWRRSWPTVTYHAYDG
jgi:uncharacterized protein